MNLLTARPLLIGAIIATGACMDGGIPFRGTNEAGNAIHSDEGPARNQRIRGERLAKIDRDLEVGAINRDEYKRRKAKILDEYWQSENSRRHRAAATIHGPRRDHLPTP